MGSSNYFVSMAIPEIISGTVEGAFQTLAQIRREDGLIVAGVKKVRKVESPPVDVISRSGLAKTRVEHISRVVRASRNSR